MPGRGGNHVPTLKIGVVGGGRRCLSLLQVLESQRHQGLRAEIAGVADVNPEALGFQYARSRGIFTTDDFTRLFAIPGLELIVNLTGNQGLAHELDLKKPGDLPVLNYTASKLFQEIVQEVIDSTRQIAEQEDELSRTRSFLEAIAQVTVIGVMVLDTNYRIVWINNSALKQAGLSQKEALGQYCFQISHQSITPCDSPETPCPMKETLQTGRSAHAIHEHIHQDHIDYCDVSTFPLVNKNGDIVQVLEVIWDITEDMNAKLERRTRAIKDDLAHLVQEDRLISLGKLVASVAHEINNPIGSIINFNKLILKTLKEGAISEQDRVDFERYLDLCVREAERCGRIVCNLLSFSRQQAIEPKKIDLGEMLDRIVMLTHHKMALANVVCEVKLENKTLEAWGDHTQIQQCFTNFIFNALEAMPDGGRLEIRGGLDPDAGEAWVEISDTGVGISQEIRDRIFEPFFSTKTEVFGVGLGLSMVYGIIKEHRGRITVDSTPGQGTTFRVFLPCGPSSAETGVEVAK